jgi:hypothetical protein
MVGVSVSACLGRWVEVGAFRCGFVPFLGSVLGCSVLFCFWYHAALRVECRLCFWEHSTSVASQVGQVGPRWTNLGGCRNVSALGGCTCTHTCLCTHLSQRPSQVCWAGGCMGGWVPPDRWVRCLNTSIPGWCLGRWVRFWVQTGAGWVGETGRVEQTSACTRTQQTLPGAGFSGQVGWVGCPRPGGWAAGARQVGRSRSGCLQVWALGLPGGLCLGQVLFLFLCSVLFLGGLFSRSCISSSISRHYLGSSVSVSCSFLCILVRTGNISDTVHFTISQILYTISCGTAFYFDIYCTCVHLFVAVVSVRYTQVGCSASSFGGTQVPAVWCRAGLGGYRYLSQTDSSLDLPSSWTVSACGSLPPLQPPPWTADGGSFCRLQVVQVPGRCST